jgi:hypothetical protein
MINFTKKLKLLEKNSKEIFFILFTTSLFYLIFFTTQNRIANDTGWDGGIYYNMIDKNFDAILPFALRIGLPRFIDYFPIFSDNLDNFILYQSLIGFLFSYFSWTLLRKLYQQSSFYTIFIGWIFLNLSELSIFKQILWIPPGTDALFSLLFILMLLIIFSQEISLKKNLFFMFIIFFIGTLNRENFIFNYILVALFYLIKFQYGYFYLNPVRFCFIKLLVPLLGIIFAAICIYLYTGHLIIGNKIEVLKFHLLHQRFFIILLSILITYGQFFIIIFSSINKKINLDKKIFFHLFLFLIFSIFISFLGGQNFERFLWWFSPILVIFSVPTLDYLIKNKKYFMIFNSIIFFIVFHRVLIPIDALINPDTLLRGCSLSEYIKGYSPNLMHFGSLCMVTAKIAEFYALIAFFFSFVLFGYIKLSKLKRFL